MKTFKEFLTEATNNIVDDIVKMCKTLNKQDDYIGIKLKYSKDGREGIRYLFIYDIDGAFEVIYDDKETFKDRDLKKALNKWLSKYKDVEFKIIRKVIEYGD